MLLPPYVLKSQLCSGHGTGVPLPCGSWQSNSRQRKTPVRKRPSGAGST